jgi:surface-anchored protein
MEPRDRCGGAFGSTILIDPNQGNAFSIHIADLDGDSNPDMVTTGTRSETRPSAVRVYINKTGEDPIVLVPPAARTRVAGDPIDFSLYFGFPITVTGTPRIALDLGGNTVYANYVSGSGTPTLNFRYTVTATDLDLDGVQLASNTIQLNGGTLTDPLGGAGVLEFPNVPFNGVIVNGRGPLVQSITRLDSQATAAGTVRFNVQFAEAVTGLDLADLAVRMSAGDLNGATVTGLTGSGSLYEVTVSTGTGSGTLGLSVNGTAGIFDLNGDVLGKGYAGGEVYTVRPTAVGPIDTYYVQGHADYSVEYNNGDFSYYLDPDDGLLPQNKYQSDEAITYLDSTAIVNRPAGTNYDFLGVAANQPLYLSNSSGNIASVPFVGWGGDNLKADEFADRLTGDPRISGSTLREYVKMQMVGFRSSSGGDFSLYSISSGNPTVWFATSDGIGNTDNIWLYRTHFHRNTAFSKPGTYEIDVVMSGYLDGNANNALDATDVYVESGIKTMVFHVNTLGAVSDAYTLYGNGQLQGSVTANDSWNDSLGVMSASVETNPAKGSLTLQADGTFTYVPSELFDGSDSFVYRLTNSRGGFTTATATITGSELPGFHAGLTQGHGDLGFAFEEGAWDLHVHVEGEEHEAGEGEEHEHGGLEYGPDQILIQVGTASATTVPNDPAFSFIGAPGGSGIFVLPAVQNPALPFLGFATEEIAAGTFQNDEFTLRLKSVSGPGAFSLWSTDEFGIPTSFMTTSNGIDGSDVLGLNTGGHFHFDMAFTQSGVYAITLEATGVLEADGSTVSSGDVTWYFAVNTGAAPTITLPEAVTTYTEQATARIVASNISLSDLDSLNFDGGQLRVDIPIHAQTGDELQILHQGNGTNQIGVSGNTVTIGVAGGSTVVIGTFTGGTNGDPLVVALTDQATPPRVQALMRRIAFRNMTDDPTNEERAVRFVVADGDGEISDAVIREVAVIPVNDAPVVVTSEGSSSYVENDPAIIIDSAVTVSDVDSTNFEGGKLTISIAVNRQTTDRLTILSQGDGPGEINVSGTDVLYEGVVIGTYAGGYTSSSPLVVTLSGSATPAAIQQLARQVGFHNSGDNPTALSRTVRFVTSDGDGKTSVAATKTVDVTVFNDAPDITSFTTPVSYTEARTAVLAASSALLTDADSNFAGGVLTISLISGGGSADVLAIRSQGVANGRINLDGANITYQVAEIVSVIGTWSGGDGVNPLVVSFNANATRSAVQAVLRNVTFRVIGSTPNSSRTMEITLTDGDGGTSTPVQRTINVIAVNDAPMVVTSEGSSSYMENDPAIIIDSAVTVEDVDSPDFNGGKLTISIAVNRQTTDRLTILAQGDGPGEVNVSGTDVLYEGVVIGTYAGGYTSSNPLVVTLNASATPVSVLHLARRVAFHNSGDNPTDLTRTVSLMVSDGDGKTSLAATKSVAVTAVNDAPVISNIGVAVNYKQNTAPVSVAGSAVVTDPDSANFQGGSLTVSLISGGIAADEVGIRSQGAGNGRINVDGANVTYGVGGVAIVIGTWSGGSGTDPLVVTLNGNATPVAVQALIRNITFRVIGSTPTSSRTIRFSLSDGDGGMSLDTEKQLNVLGTNL